MVVTAPAPAVILPKSMASPSLLAHLITSKFVDGLPLYRVSRQLERSGMDLSPGTAGTWVNEVGLEKVVPLINVMHEELLADSLVHMDETYLQVLKSDKAPTSDHFMVVRAAGPPGKRIVLYNYIPSRTTEALKQLLMGPEGAYRGKLLTDGLERYDEICRELNLLHFGCMQHCRQYYFKARKVSQLPSNRTLANAAIEGYIRRVFAVEDDIQKLREDHERRGEILPPATVLALRQNRSKPVLETFKAWVEDLLPGTPPKSALGQALAYTHNQWEKLTRHLEHPDVPAHNNYVEQQIKQFAVGRKAWLFNHDKVGAQASANLFSLVTTARVNDVEPFAYLSYLFEHLPAANTVEELEALLPWNAKAALPQR
jgi:transposase